jgi:hypothetical protein
VLWLERTPESFVPGIPDSDAERFHLPTPGGRQIVRWNVPALYAALNAERQSRGLTWQAVAREIGGVTPGTLMNLSRASRVGFPGVMRIVQWLGQPATTFTMIVGRYHIR